jgi:hypothetical protein
MYCDSLKLIKGSGLSHFLDANRSPLRLTMRLKTLPPMFGPYRQEGLVIEGVLCRGFGAEFADAEARPCRVVGMDAIGARRMVEQRQAPGGHAPSLHSGGADDR